MKSKTEYLSFNTPTRRAFVNITPNVRKIIEESGIKEGLCLVDVMHITASVFINDNESGLHRSYSFDSGCPKYLIDLTNMRVLFGSCYGF